MAVNDQPFFSIVIPVLNEEKALPALLSDLANQTIRDFEVIVVDGHSTDKTVARAKEWKDKLPSLTVLTSKIRNVSHQRNQGAQEAKGKYILWNDADNNLPKYYLEGLRFHLHVRPVDTFTVWCNADSDKSSDRTIATYLNLLVETAYLLGNPAAFGAMIGCRTKSFQKTGGFNPEVGFAEDTEFVRQAFKKGMSFAVFHEPRYVYSLRRFRKIGILKAVKDYAILNLKYITKQKVDQKKEYPMGGELFSDMKTAQMFIKVDGSFKKLLKKPKILDKISALLSLEEK
ncbi:MAG: Glycosyl transferase family 2 [Candidatus Collierbacteria bacterium GW2011_GWB1_44_35]|uniref:Glycosyl transferase family 2 n=2 Tax=Candidatus Collieribacteriota TaxID=1752725 RepID=A0A0G1LGE8_9BACT|nr:MAG: Glycosyl transferase family 2 [Candidatus Collierbacteria bacterium GW2011_GWF1_44_12]KKT67802.1 MAG: Glycosyl transferase family 2 [Candidatus Collierbacteria bacterium GW2011_GWB1_44_35]